MSKGCPTTELRLSYKLQPLSFVFHCPAAGASVAGALGNAAARLMIAAAERATAYAQKCECQWMIPRQAWFP